MPCTEAQKRGNAAYNRRQDNIMIRPSKDKGGAIRAAAAAAGSPFKHMSYKPALSACSAVASRPRKQPMRINRIHNTTPRRAAARRGVMVYAADASVR